MEVIIKNLEDEKITDENVVSISDDGKVVIVNG